jgi:hypothetical protein
MEATRFCETAEEFINLRGVRNKKAITWAELFMIAWKLTLALAHFVKGICGKFIGAMRVFSERFVASGVADNS